MLSKKPIRVFSLVVAIIFFILSLGNIALRLHSCSLIDKPVTRPPAYASGEKVGEYIAYKKFCRNYLSYFILSISVAYLASTVINLKRKP